MRADDNVRIYSVGLPGEQRLEGRGTQFLHRYFIGIHNIWRRHLPLVESANAWVFSHRKAILISRRLSTDLLWYWSHASQFQCVSISISKLNGPPRLVPIPCLWSLMLPRPASDSLIQFYILFCAAPPGPDCATKREDTNLLAMNYS